MFSITIRVGVLFSLLAMPVVVRGQSSTIVGTVTDRSGAVVPGAAVTAKNLNTSEARSVITSELGQYTIPNLPVGMYQVTAQRPGFQRSVVDQVKLEVQLTRTVNLVLQVGDVAEQVSVTANATPLETNQSSVGTLMENKVVNELPLNGRNFLQLQLLLPGVTIGRSGTWQAVKIDSESTSIGGGNFTVNGMRDLYNDYLLDGSSFKEWIHGTAGMNPSVDAVQEFRTQTSSYSAEFGANAGGLVNMVTKSGTNSLHGSAYDFLRNDKLDAANFFTNRAGQQKTPLRRNQFGGTLGGPIRRDKTFFFGSYEGFRERRSSTLYGTFPTAAMRQGDFSELLSLPSPRVVRDPLTNQPFPGNVIPSQRILGVWQDYFRQYIPLPMFPGLVNNYIIPRSRTNNVDQVIGRFDHQLSKKTTLSGHYMFNRVFDQPPNLNPTVYVTQEGRNQNAVLHVNHLLTPATILDYHIGYNRFKQNLVSSRANTTPYITRDVLHINGLATDPRSSEAPGISANEFSGLGGAAVSAPREWISERFEHNASFYLVRGSHNVRGGLQAFRHHETFPETFIANGTYSFTGAFTGYGMADLLLGAPASFAASPDLFDPGFRFWEIMPWIQDDWRVTPNLTINIGLRYERWGRPESKYNAISNIRLPGTGGQASLVVAAPCKPDQTHACQTSLPVSIAPTRSTLQSDNNNFAPRVGLAYRFGSSGRTVLRTAYGIFYQREPINQFIFLSINPPFVSYYTVFNSTPQDFQQFDFYNPLRGQPPGGVQFSYIPENYRDAYLQAWNIGIQRELGAGIVTDISYVGNKDTKLVARTWPNQPTPGPGPIDPRRPYNNVSQIAGNEPIGNSNYHSLQLKLEKRFSQGLSFLAAYTFSKAITDSQAAESGEWSVSNIQIKRDLKSNRGLFAGDARNRFTLSSLYELPIGRGKPFFAGVTGPVDKIVSGWQVGVIATFQSGMPLSAGIPTDIANVGDGSRFPDRIADPNNGPKTVDQFFNTAAFRLPAQYTFGNAGPTPITGPGINMVDVSFMKNVRIRERINLQFRAEMFNFANHVILGNPGTTLGTPTYGKINGTRLDSREIQLALRLQF